MLVTLCLKNYIFIDEMELDFNTGLTMVTGETGAGKSILVDAIELVLGEKMDSACIQNGKDFCEITGVFQTHDRNVLEHAGIEDETLVIRRSITKDGRSKCYINDRMVSVSTLRQLGRYLIDIHGQHSHQLLLESDEQMEIVDRFGNVGETKECVAALYHEKKRVEQELAIYLEQKERAQQNVELYAFQKNEIEHIAPVEGENEALEKERRMLSDSDKICRIANELVCDISDDDGCISHRAARATKNCVALTQYDAQFAALAQDAERCMRVFDEIASQISSFQQRLEFDPKRLECVLERLEQIGRLTKKYGPTIADVLRHRDTVAAALASITGSEEREEALRAACDDIDTRLKEHALKLSKLRSHAAQKLEALVTYELKSLDMHKTEFSITVRQQKNPDGTLMIDTTGCDRVEYFVRTNVGSELRPLAQIISGGELSRVMLALKASVAPHDRVNTLVFDEIDTGLGGKTAFVVGKKLSKLSASHQVLCITHLPQVAAFADHHYVVTKKTERGTTKTEVIILEADARVQEISRMLGGATITDVTVQHARELCALAAEEKKLKKKTLATTVKN